MAEFLESLTVRILGDSSGLQREVTSAREQLAGLSREVSRFSQMGSQLTQPFARLASSQRTLSSLSSALSRVSGQVSALSGMTVTLNVSPAMQALSMLSAMAMQVRAQLASLGAVGGGGVAAPTAGAALPRVNSSRVAGYASGGLVMGPAGIDQVPAMLTAGEFVLQREAVARLGLAELSRLNQGRDGSDGRHWQSQWHPMQSQQPATSSSTQNVHQYGDIAIHVGGGQVGDVVRDLQYQGFRLRQRRG
ncbi:hypothetical protein [Lacunimicrobium album]